MTMTGLSSPSRPEDPSGAMREALHAKIAGKTARIGIIGLGYVRIVSS